MEHDWLPTTIGNGEKICRRCWNTNTQLAAAGQLLECTEPGRPVPPPQLPPEVFIEYALLDDEDGHWISIKVNGHPYGEIGPFDTMDERERAYVDLQAMTAAHGTPAAPQTRH